MQDKTFYSAVFTLTISHLSIYFFLHDTLFLDSTSSLCVTTQIYISNVYHFLAKLPTVSCLKHFSLSFTSIWVSWSFYFFFYFLQLYGIPYPFLLPFYIDTTGPWSIDLLDLLHASHLIIFFTILFSSCISSFVLHE